MMASPPNEIEQNVINAQFTQCDGCCTRRDVIFLFPIGNFGGNPKKVAKRLQRAFNFLLKATPVEVSPTIEFGHRVIVGFRHPDADHDPDVQAGWVRDQNRINVPWGRLEDPETDPIHVSIDDQPEFTVSHELVHPFETLFLLRPQNRKWNEAICEFMRVFVLWSMGFPALADQFAVMLTTSVDEESRDRYHHAGGLILRRWLIGGRMACPSSIKAFLRDLVDTEMSADLDPGETIAW